jgi:hypothetical protein
MLRDELPPRVRLEEVIGLDVLRVLDMADPADRRRVDVVAQPVALILRNAHRLGELVDPLVDDLVEARRDELRQLGAQR